MAATTTARNKKQVDEMTSSERLWDSLNYSYGKKRDNSDEEFRKAYSQADRQMLSRGMQRSSYGAQTLANIDKQRVDAQNDIFDVQIADYENRLQQAEQQELENDRWERQFAAGREDAEWNRNFQQERANAQDTQFQLNFDEGQRQFNENLGTQKEQWQKQFEAGRSDTAWNQAFQREQADTQKGQWQQQFAEGQRQFNENLGYQRERAGVADTQWQKQFDAGRSDTAWNQAFQREQADTQKNQWNATFNYQQQRDAVGDQQWQKAFDQNNTDTDRKLAASYVSAIIANGQDPTDELLARAGLSRADANAMKAQVAESGGGWSGESSGGGRSSSSNKSTTPPPVSDGGLDGLLNNNNKTGSTNKPIAGIASDLFAAYKDKGIVNSVQNEILAGTKARALNKTTQNKATKDKIK